MAEFNFPTEFAPELVPLRDVGLDARGLAALDAIEATGVTMYSGLTEEVAPLILDLATTDPRILENCPNDAIRFNERWQSKGRGLIVGLDQNRLPKIYNWLGVELCDELPDHPITSAFRSTISGTGTNNVALTLSAGRALYGAHHIGLQTLATNETAIGSYVNNGAQIVRVRSKEIDEVTGQPAPFYRPTYDQSAVVFVRDGRGYRQDVLLFMAFPEPTPLFDETQLVLA